MIDFWSSAYWLPGNVTWDDLKSHGSLRYPQRVEFLNTIVIGLALMVIRIWMEAFVFLPIGWAAGWVRTPLLARMRRHLLGGFAGRSKFKRVAECAWRFSYYCFAFSLGLYVLWDQPQSQDVENCWRLWPRHHVPDKIIGYYMMETAFYWGLLFSQIFFDVRRADFYQMTLHHGVTIALLWVSWSMNMIRVGTLVLLSHDAADILLELGKLFRYAGWNKLLEKEFVFFLFAWIGTRLVYYPFWLVHSVLFDAPHHIQDSYSWLNVTQNPIMPRVLVVMLCLLVVLHVIWTVIILKIAYTSLGKSGEVADIREENDSDVDDEEEESIEEDKKVR